MQEANENMEKTSIKRPITALKELRKNILPTDIPYDAKIELVLNISADDITIRDLNAFLELIDHVYGRLSPKGFRSYSLRKYRQLKISRIEQGSLQLVIETVVSFARELDIIIILWLSLKYLPQASQGFATAYNQYEQGRLARETRKRIRNEMEVDDKLRNLTTEQRRDLAMLIDHLFKRDSKKLPRAIRFATSKLNKVYLRIRKKNIRK
jgi:hypothetical protein